MTLECKLQFIWSTEPNLAATEREPNLAATEREPNLAATEGEPNLAATESSTFPKKT